MAKVIQATIVVEVPYSNELMNNCTDLDKELRKVIDNSPYLDCKVIAGDLPYVHEIIVPSLAFDPYSSESISNAILKATQIDNLPETKVW